MYEEANEVQIEKHRAVEEELDRLCSIIEMLDKNIWSLSGRLEKISVIMPEVSEVDSEKNQRSDSEITRRIRCICETVQNLSSRVRNMEVCLEV